ncbi:hypothetical protein BZG36_00437 [Bifiguratus adelaidae]|uniref:Exostosin GT47 domain-containing protein n=1 Tax=Bifiguratus adelaidae TaxID=1938954 RepID=A0A261Y7P4_9FUNG|nr:hypothetical protein BZG36_00437 [Bifiguratus adelaidae]
MARRILLLITGLIILTFIYISGGKSSARSGIAAPLPPVENTRSIWPPRLQDAICRPNIYVYTIPDDIQVSKHIQDTSCFASNYKSELILYNQLRDPTSKVHQLFVTNDPQRADFFYIPFLGACWLTKCWSEHNWNWNERCGVDDVYVRPLMNYIIRENPYWNRSQGRDHIMVHPMDHTSTYYETTRDSFKNAIFLTTVGDKRSVRAHAHRRYRDIVIPSATGILHRAMINPLDYLTQTGSPKPHISRSGRTIKVLFRGLYQNVPPNDVYSLGIRSLFSTFEKLPGWDLAASATDDDYAQRLAKATFGLTPMGWTLDTTRLWEYLAFGVIPVIIADGIIEPFEDDVDWHSFAVFVRREDAHRLPAILAKYTPDDIARMQHRD